jgi:hypothetical protein
LIISYLKNSPDQIIPKIGKIPGKKKAGHIAVTR